MAKLDQAEKIILRELIRNPRISDNAIGKKTKIPVKTVNNKRKKMENEGFLYYFCFVNQGPDGTKAFNARYHFKMTFKEGITRKSLMDLLKNEGYHPLFFKHLYQSWVSEDSGHVILNAIMESRVQEDMVDIINAEMVPFFFNYYGKDCIKSIATEPIYSILRHHHNYLPYRNMEKGKISDSWKDEWIHIE